MGDYSRTYARIQGNRHASGSGATPSASYAIPDGMQNPYDTLGVSFNCTDAELNKEFKEKTLKYHPDKQHGKSEKEIAANREPYEKTVESSRLVT